MIRVYTKTDNFVAKMIEQELSCYALAKLIGEENSTMCRIKNGKISVKINSIKIYCHILKCDFDDIFYIKENF